VTRPRRSPASNCRGLAEGIGKPTGFKSPLIGIGPVSCCKGSSDSLLTIRAAPRGKDVNGGEASRAEGPISTFGVG
jgi:hypothetical protein